MHLPVIALTASAMKRDRERCLTAGMDACISRPFNAHDLERLVETLANKTSYGATHTSEPETRESINDFSNALARLDNNADILREQMRLFVEDSPALLARIQSAIGSAS